MDLTNLVKVEMCAQPKMQCATAVEKQVILADVVKATRKMGPNNRKIHVDRVNAETTTRIAGFKTWKRNSKSKRRLPQDPLNKTRQQAQSSKAGITHRSVT